MVAEVDKLPAKATKSDVVRFASTLKTIAANFREFGNPKKFKIC